MHSFRYLFSVNKKYLRGVHFYMAKEIKHSILGKSELTPYQLAKLVEKTTSTYKLGCSLIVLAEMFINEGLIEGVRGDIAFCQSIHETSYFRYGGQVLPAQNNYAGIGALNNLSVGKGAWFPDPATGVRAQIQHLKGYASKKPLNKPCVDPRYTILVEKGLIGTAPNWEDLNGKWAFPGENYGQTILAIYEKTKTIPLPEQKPIQVPIQVPIQEKIQEPVKEQVPVQIIQPENSDNKTSGWKNIFSKTKQIFSKNKK